MKKEQCDKNRIIYRGLKKKVSLEFEVTKCKWILLSGPSVFFVCSNGAWKLMDLHSIFSEVSFYYF